MRINHSYKAADFTEHIGEEKRGDGGSGEERRCKKEEKDKKSNFSRGLTGDSSSKTTGPGLMGGVTARDGIV